jgi:CheY-like chemotaxis protein
VTAPIPLHVLLVEDDDDTREVLQLILESDGMTVIPAQDGWEGLARLEEVRRREPEATCAIVLDYMMPRFSGAQFREHQLANPAIADLPVILVSAVSDLPSHADALAPYAVLQKPINPDQLTTVVRKACEAYLKRQAAND